MMEKCLTQNMHFVSMKEEFERLRNEERIKRENLEFECKELMDAICQTRKDLRELTELYQK